MRGLLSKKLSRLLNHRPAIEKPFLHDFLIQENAITDGKKYIGNLALKFGFQNQGISLSVGL
jgi:hypothetical protein